MARAAAAAGVAVEILVEQRQVAPMGIVGISRFIAVAWAAAIFIGQEEIHEPSRDFQSHVFQIHPASGPGWALDPQAIAIEIVIALKGLYDGEIDRHPDGTAPV